VRYLRGVKGVTNLIQTVVCLCFIADLRQLWDQIAGKSTPCAKTRPSHLPIHRERRSDRAPATSFCNRYGVGASPAIQWTTRLSRSSRIGRERYPEYLAAIPRNDHLTAVVGEAGVRLEFGNDLVRMIPCRLVINEDCSHFVIDLLFVVEDEEVSRHAEPRRSDPFTIVPFKLHGRNW
jgi:hypothetical protein